MNFYIHSRKHQPHKDPSQIFISSNDIPLYKIFYTFPTHLE